MAQSNRTGVPVRARTGAGIDSVEAVRQYVRNAKAVLDSLTALHYARLSITKLGVRLKKAESGRDSVGRALVSTSRDMARAELERANALALAYQYRQQRRWSKVENWLWRLAAGYFIYKQICPSCPP
ncbi:hypothetical protein F5984_19955 [Rudanella paleaurantiibacter]|uniref:Uncharacterized protein n=1 Tax=Rudanella paleaurantiibacter TaxID=2614655 RepID=A0A7J5TV57_9BACT|nr:hypothetical protein [Rudanella paleaurantiibacter]KAB7728031.1 hypothetical protein F5984_19955 [Rudanella paleaurantiibacter]